MQIESFKKKNKDEHSIEPFKKKEIQPLFKYIAQAISQIWGFFRVAISGKAWLSDGNTAPLIK